MCFGHIYTLSYLLPDPHHILPIQTHDLSLKPIVSSLVLDTKLLLEHPATLVYVAYLGLW